MSLVYENLDDKTRKFMLKEVNLDISKDTLYLSPRLTESGIQGYKSLLVEAIENHDDAWLANELRQPGYIKLREQRRKRGGGYTSVKVSTIAHETLAEGEFNRFYVRGLCARAIEENIAEVQVYRGKLVRSPRSASEAKIGAMVSAQALLEDLRVSPGVEPALGLPPGPNSGLTIRLKE